MKKKVLRSKSAGGTSLEYRLFVTSVVEAIIDGLRTADIDRNWICRTAEVRIPSPSKSRTVTLCVHG
jgi:hypothetical protein